MQQSVLGHLAAVMTGMTVACRGYIQRRRRNDRIIKVGLFHEDHSCLDCGKHFEEWV